MYFLCAIFWRLLLFLSWNSFSCDPLYCSSCYTLSLTVWPSTNYWDSVFVVRMQSFAQYFFQLHRFWNVVHSTELNHRVKSVPLFFSLLFSKYKHSGIRFHGYFRFVLHFFFRFVVWLSECKEYSRIFFFLVGFIVCGTAQSEIIREWSECQKWIWREKNFIINPFCGRKNERESFNKANNFSIAYGNQANTQKCAFIHKFNYTECLHSLGNLAIHSAKSDRYFRISMDNTHATCYSV